ncbi:MAG: catechol 2,3-dioxygenase-like lactoylglutathione lyase family enzyme [Alphaproteobacteria bacterium]
MACNGTEKKDDVKMGGFSVLSANHTSFTVSDLDRSVGFFCDALGFALLSKAPRDAAIIRKITGVDGADIIVAYVEGPGGHRIELIEYLAPADRRKVVSRPCDTGFAHLAYDVDDIDAALAASALHGFQPLGAPVAINKGPNTGARVVYLRDDDGVTVEFIEKATET